VAEAHLSSSLEPMYNNTNKCTFDDLLFHSQQP
jgi:hypothetical protein